MTKLGAFYVTLKNRGVRNTLAILLSYGADYSFDLRYGTDTRSWASLDSLAIDSDNKVHGEMYQPTMALPLARLFKTLNLPADGALVDLGCGKARVLLLAAQAGIPAARGVEFSPELCRIARHNCALFAQKTRIATAFEIVEADVVDYAVRPDETVFFLANPFDGAVLTRVLENIKTSQRTHPRPLWIIYRNAVHSAVIDDDPAFVRLRDYVFWGLDFVVYSNQGAPHAPATSQPAASPVAPI